MTLKAVQAKANGPTKVVPPQHNTASKSVKKKIVAVKAGSKVKVAKTNVPGLVKKMADTCSGNCNCPDCKIKGSLTHHKTAKTAGIDVNDLAAGVRVANGLNY